MSQDWGDIIRRYYDDEAARKIEDALSDMPEELVPDGICDRKELFVKDKLLFPYTPVNQGRFAKPDQDPDQQTAAWESLVRATIPEDGRVALPFHFLRPLREEYIAWHEENSRYRKMTPKQILAMAGSARKSRYTELRSKQTLHYMDTHPEEGFCDAEQSFPLPREWPQRIADRIESAKSAMESFFCKDFGNFGNFIIQDIDPRTGQQISYDINSPKPRYGDGKEYWDKNYSFKLSAIADRQDQMATKGAFSTANQPPNRIAPWQRIICCEGLSLTSPAAKQNQLFPFQWELGWDSTLGMMAAKMHLSGILRGGNESANPYSHPDHAFHLTFFEKLQGLKVEMEDYYRARISIPDLKTGHLFGGLQRGRQDKPSAQRGWKQAFHRSSFTVHTVSADYEKHVADCWHWTMVILAPRDFFHIVGASSSLLAGDIIATGQASHQTAQLSRVVYALNKVGERWRELEEHIGDLLMEDFMDPVAYCQLLFDDSTFSRSRLYFWVLACLNEFDEVMEDNITQWTLYRAARVTPRLRSASEASSAASSPSSSPDPEPSEGGPPHKFNRAKDEAWFVELDRKAEQARRDLEKAREGFEVKKKRVIALRDGLFNASALIESRSSTRLGMNVQLLTYVSIFYLPMGFCAALWAVPNITDRQTQTPFVLTAVLTGLVTYLAVFNLENLARLPGRVYASRRERLVRQMERDGDEAWKGRSGEFEEFPPSAGQRRPSEWWIVGYQMLRLLRGLRKAAAFGIAVVVSYIDFIRRLPTSRRQREENSDEEKSDV